MTHLTPEKHVTPLRFFLAINKKEVKWVLLNSLLYTSGTAALIGVSYFIGKIIDALRAGDTNFKALIVVFVVVLVLNEIFYRLGHILEVTVNARIRQRVKKELFAYTSKLSFSYFANRFAGQISHQISTAAESLERMKNILTNDFIDSAVMVVISAFALGLVYLPLSIAVIVWALFFSFGLLPFIKNITRTSEQFAENSAHTTGVMVDTYSNIATVKVYSKTFDQGRIYDQVDKEAKSQLAVGKWEVLAYAYQGFAGIILCFVLLGITVHGYSTGLVSLGELFLISTLGLKILAKSYEIGHIISNYIRSQGECAQALKDILVPETIVDGNQSANTAWESITVTYDDVTFFYNKNKKILNQFSLQIPAGQKIGIVGLSGAGKTTLMNLLLRFFDPQQGKIIINDIDISTLTQESLRSHISFISQDTSLFHTSIADNISYGSSHATKEDTKRAAEMAHADEFIQDLPKKYDTIVGERGVKLSGGQRQRIAIARAMLKNSPLFLLDEATSALDSDSEAKVQDALKILMEGKTVIAIAHRLSTLQFMDRIIFVDNGKIVEDGTHAELLERNGKYAELWNMQTGGFIITGSNMDDKDDADDILRR